MCENVCKFLCKQGNEGQCRDSEMVERSRLWEFLQVIVKKNGEKSTIFGD